MKLKEKLYLKKIELLHKYGMSRGYITPFSSYLYKELNETIINNIPVSMEIKYLKPNVSPGRCYDRSLMMFFAMEESELVRGSLEYFRIFGDEESENHGWVERYDYVYDPTWRFIYDKDFYYKIYNVKNTSRYNINEYCTRSNYNKETYEKIKSTTRETIKTNLNAKVHLLITVPILRELAKNNEKFKNELEKYLEEINYDEDEIIRERDEKLQKIFVKEKTSK